MAATIILSEAVARKMPLHDGSPSAFLVAAQLKREKKKQDLNYCTSLFIVEMVCSKQSCLDITVRQICWLHKIWTEIKQVLPQALLKIMVKQTSLPFWSIRHIT